MEETSDGCSCNTPLPRGTRSQGNPRRSASLSTLGNSEESIERLASTASRPPHTPACPPVVRWEGGRRGRGDTSLLGEIRQLGVIALVAKHSSPSTKRHKLTKGMSTRETNIRCRRGESMKPTNHMRRLQGSARASALSSALFSVSASPFSFGARNTKLVNARVR